MYKIENYYLSKENLFELYILLKDVTTILKKHNIKYWADGGTLLGICRNGSQIPYDDDLDLGIDVKYKNELHNIVNEFIELGYGYVEYNEMSKVYIPNKWRENNFRISGTPTLDIFYYKLKKGKYVLNDLNLRNTYKNNYYSKDKLYPLKQMKYMDLYISVPNDPADTLDRQYKDWRYKLVVEVREKPTKEQINVKDKKLLFDRITEKYIKEL